MSRILWYRSTCALLIGVAAWGVLRPAAAQPVPDGESPTLRAVLADDASSIEILRDAEETPIVTQVAHEKFRPYLHPILAPDGSGRLTESRPPHHPHQTGLYWGFTDVNGRDYFHHPGATHWRRVAVTVLKERTDQPGDAVQWQTVYDLLDGDGVPLLRESQIWSMSLEPHGYQLDLQWTGDAERDVTIGEHDYGGLFLRMPWRQGVRARAVNSARRADERAEGQRAIWLDLGMEIGNGNAMSHVAILDHPNNPGFPTPWRVDHQYGVGPAPTRLGPKTIPAGKSLGYQYRLLIYSGELNDVEVTDRWSEYSGQSGTWAQWNLARQEGREAKFLSPEAAVDAMTVRDGFRVTAFASEPMITQPMAFCWDDRGRMWVAENRDYENRRTGFSGSGDSRIVILEDTDGDGKADQRQVFVEGIPFPSAIATGFGGLWLGAPPNLLFLPDRDGDDRADHDAAEVRLTGWGIRDRHETLNSLHWGPDGWLYGLQGFATPSEVGKPAGEGRIYRAGEPYPSEIQFDGPTTAINGGVWRYHPTKDRFEVVAHGFSNPWGIDYDEHGQLFITACVIPHLWHVIPGGIYHRQGGRHFNAHVYDDIKTIADHRHRSAHGGARIYLSDAFPERYRGRIFMANIHEHAVLTDVLRRHRSGFVGEHGDDFLLANNAQWVGFSVEIGPAGDVYVLDWHDADICGSDVHHKETGRVFRIAPHQSLARDFRNRRADLATLSDAELVALQESDSAWHARRARVILQHRATERPIDAKAVTKLREIFQTADEVPLRLRALWALHVIEAIDYADLVASLGDPAEYVRGWAIQLLCEDRDPPRDALEAFSRLAAADDSPVVRLFLAAALQRLDASERWQLLDALVRRGEDAGDHNIPKMIWFALEPLVPHAPERSLRLAAVSELPLVTRHVVRRLADADRLVAVSSAIGDAADQRASYAVASGAPDADAKWKAMTMALGMRDALEGRYDVSAPEGWGAASRALRSLGPRAERVAVDLSQQFGDRRAAKQMFAVLTDADAETDRRREALENLAAQRHPRLAGELVTLLNDPEVRTAAIRATASYDDNRLTERLLEMYPSLDRDERLEAVLALASRSGSGRALTRAIDRGSIPRGEIPAYVVRLLHRVVGAGFVEVWGPIGSRSADTQALFAKYRTLLTPSRLRSADPRKGRDVFARTCQACHELHGDGGKVGPDITGANRGNLEYLLGNILTPSAEIQDAYRMQIVLTDDGRVYSGIPAQENERQLRLRVANQDEPVAIAKSSIESRQVASVSMMPDGLLNELSDDEVANLVAYLQTKSQVPRAER